MPQFTEKQKHIPIRMCHLKECCAEGLVQLYPVSTKNELADLGTKALGEFRTALLQRFEGTYEGEVHTYLECEILRELEAGKTLLSQKHYVEDVLRTYDYWDCIPAHTPMTPCSRLTKELSDLAWSCSELSKYVQNPGKAHMDAADHVLRYLRGTYDQAIVYERTDNLANTIWGWVDSDWAADLDSRRSPAMS